MESDKRLTSLENGFKIVKGEIKALLIDIREIMNNIENPFYNTQGITGGPDTSVEANAELKGDAPVGSVQPEDMLEQEPEREHHPGFAEMPVQHQGMQPMGVGHAPNVAETPMQQGMPMQQMGGTPEPYHPGFAEMPVQHQGMQPMGVGHAPNVAETPMQQGMPMQQMGGTPEPYHPGFAEMPVQHDGAKQEGIPDHVPDFAEMFKQYEEAKQSGDDGTKQEETPDHVPDFAEMFKQYEEAKQSEDSGTKQEETPDHVPDFAEMFKQYEEAKQSEDSGTKHEETPDHVLDLAEMFKQYEEAKQSEKMPEEIPGIPHDNGFDIYTLAELMRWTDYTLKTIERSRLDELLDLCVFTGHISETIKDTVSKIADLSTQEVAEGSTSTMQDHIAAMFQLNAVLNPSESDQKAIYSIYGELPWRTVV